MADPNTAPTADPAAQPAPAAAGAPPAAQPNAAPRNPVPASALPEAALLAKKQKWQQEAREAVMRELGIEDPDAWRAEQAKQREAFDAQRRQQEEAERAKLSEVERYKADLKARDEELAAIKLDRDAKQREATVAKIEVLSRSAATPHIADELYEDARARLQRYVDKLPERDRRRFDADDAAEFYKDLAKKIPRFARDRPAAPKPAVPPTRRPLTTGAPPARTTVPAGSQAKQPDATGGKTMAPGKPNSMTAEEVAAQAAKSFGITYRPYGGGARSAGRAGPTNGTPALGAAAANGARPTK